MSRGGRPWAYPRSAFFVPKNGPEFALFCVGFVLFPTCERRDVCTRPYLQRLHVDRGAPASIGSAGTFCCQFRHDERPGLTVIGAAWPRCIPARLSSLSCVRSMTCMWGTAIEAQTAVRGPRVESAAFCLCSSGMPVRWFGTLVADACMARLLICSRNLHGTAKPLRSAN